jgi:hypothetical protein
MRKRRRRRTLHRAVANRPISPGGAALEPVRRDSSPEPIRHPRLVARPCRRGGAVRTADSAGCAAPRDPPKARSATGSPSDGTSRSGFRSALHGDPCAVGAPASRRGPGSPPNRRCSSVCEKGGSTSSRDNPAHAPRRAPSAPFVEGASPQSRVGPNRSPEAQTRGISARPRPDWQRIGQTRTWPLRLIPASKASCAFAWPARDRRARGRPPKSLPPKPL